MRDADLLDFPLLLPLGGTTIKAQVLDNGKMCDTRSLYPHLSTMNPPQPVGGDR